MRTFHILPSWAHHNTPISPPSWLPTIATDAHNIQQGTTVPLGALYASGLAPLIFSLSPTSTILTGSGISINADGSFTSTISAGVGLLMGLQQRVTQSGGLFADSLPFSLNITAAPPSWQTVPTQSIIQGGQPVGIAVYASTGNPPLTFSISPNSTVFEVTLNLGGVTFDHPTGVFTAASNATVVDYPNLVVRATDVYGNSFDSQPFLFRITSSATQTLGTWSEWACVTLIRNTSFDFAQWNSGAVGVTYQILGFYGTLTLPSGVSVNGSVITANNVAALTTLATGPNLYVKVRQTANGVDRDTTIPISVVIGDVGTPTYSAYRVLDGSLIGGPFATITLAQKAVQVGTGYIAGTTGTAGVPSTYDVIKVSGGTFPLTTSWVPEPNKMFRIIAADQTLPMIKDSQHTTSPLINNGQSANAPVNYWWDVAGIWNRNGKPLDGGVGGIVDNSPDGLGGAIRLNTVCDHTQNLTVRDSIVEDFVQASMSSNFMGVQKYINMLHINCGAASVTNCHGHYLHGDYAEIRGCLFKWTYTDDMLPVGKKSWAGCGHDIKTRCWTSIISANKILSKVQGGLSSSTSCKIDCAGDGLFYITYNILEEGIRSAYSTAQQFFFPDNKIIDYGSSDNNGPPPTPTRAASLFVYGNTIVNNGAPSEEFVRMAFGYTDTTIVPLTGSDPPSMASNTSLGVNTTTSNFTLNNVLTTLKSSGRPMFAGMPIRGQFKNASGGNTGTLGAIAPLVPWKIYFCIPIFDGFNTHFALATTKANALAGIKITLTTVTAGIVDFRVAPEVFYFKDNVALGTTNDGPAAHQIDDHLYGPDNAMGAVSLLADPNPLTSDFNLTNPTNASQLWPDPTGATDFHDPL